MMVGIRVAAAGCAWQSDLGCTADMSFVPLHPDSCPQRTAGMIRRHYPRICPWSRECRRSSPKQRIGLHMSNTAAQRSERSKYVQTQTQTVERQE